MPSEAHDDGVIAMQHSTKHVMRVSLSALSAAFLLATVVNAAEQATPSKSASINGSKGWKAPRTFDGQPDLQGNWTNATITPFTREAKYGDRLVMTADEARALESAEAEGNAKADAPTDPKLKIQDLPTDCGRGFTGVNCGYNSFWVDPGTKIMTINGEKRTSMLTTPNGKAPPRKSDAPQMAARGARGGMNDGPEMRSLGERCLLSFGSSAGPPMIPLLYNNNYQIVQSKDAVVILVEMVHDARVVRLGGQHKPDNIRQWMGDSVGHWEGDTLVVETINLRPEQRFSGATDKVKFTERFTRVAPNQISYQFTIEDPSVWDKPWGGEVAMNKSKDNIYEYACHEGNYALPGILAGAREEERAKALAATEKK
jgi:hypothetical protein